MSDKTITVNTRYFGEMSFLDDEIVTFPQGLFGFEELTRYVIIRFEKEDNSMLSLQSVEEEGLAFVLLNPFYLIADYNPAVSTADYSDVGAEEGEPLLFYVIPVIGDTVAKTTVNLKCPIIVNPTTRQAKQLILQTDEYPLRYPLSGKSGG